MDHFSFSQDDISDILQISFITILWVLFSGKKSHRFTIFFFSPNFILHDYVHYLITMTSQDNKPIIGLELELAIEWQHVCSWICFHKCKLSPGLNLENPSADIVRSFTL